MSTAGELFEWEDTEPYVPMQDPTEDEATVSDWLSRKIQRELEDYIKRDPRQGRLEDEIARQADAHDLRLAVIADLARAAELRLSAMRRIRDEQGRREFDDTRERDD